MCTCSLGDHKLREQKFGPFYVVLLKIVHVGGWFVNGPPFSNVPQWDKNGGGDMQ